MDTVKDPGLGLDVVVAQFGDGAEKLFVSI
jgi:hypothetical protein